MKVRDPCGQLFARGRRGFLAIRTQTRIFETLAAMRRILLVVMAACGDGDGTVRIPDADLSNIDAPLTCTHVQDLRLLRFRAVTFGAVRGPFDGMACIEGRSDLACATPNGIDE